MLMEKHKGQVVILSFIYFSVQGIKIGISFIFMYSTIHMLCFSVLVFHH